MKGNKTMMTVEMTFIHKRRTLGAQKAADELGAQAVA